jgi:hypothetical protein
LGVEALCSSAAESDFWTGVRTFCLLWFASAAAFFAGSILGFLFAVPKSLAVQNGTTNKTSSLYRSNTNLEEVSDWLTKIILGLGLVNLGEIVKFTIAAGEATAAAIGPAQGAFVMAVCSMIYGFVAAFIIVYSWTRIRLRRDFEESERALIARDERISPEGTSPSHRAVETM